MNPLLWLLGLFLLLPIAEIYVLIRVGGLIGAIPTIALVVFTAVLGAMLMRSQGFATLRRVQASLTRGEVPTVELLEGLVVLVGGALLLMPGFITDTLGFLALIPPTRRVAVRWFLARKGTLVPRPEEKAPDGGPSRGPTVIEGECRRVDDDHRTSGRR
ncbi:phage T7 F exclusion suppressor FxsA [bacterium BMS3Bbin12]|nr:phage T7 F exclusion suppressor FxsA [bacterium BMS3Abin12]GBE47974.1 phage T7 F exclusion suppressor FxsA [bacterium BMS3Bbin12]GBE49421.1 phage T7 F exclusion suppressor FxsA [bacterium BMS3Bbin13]HDJ85749.1 FxsA family protein [Chromatiales bacterium]